MDLYELLGVARDATTEEIAKAYRKHANKWHPDKNPGNEAAAAKFREYAQAKEILCDPDKRSIYDETGDVDATSEHQQMIEQGLIKLFFTVMDNCQLEVDIMGRLRKEVKQSIERTQGKVSSLQQLIGKDNRTLKKIKFNPDGKAKRNFLAQAMSRRIQQHRDAIEELETYIKNSHEMLEMSYSFDFEGAGTAYAGRQSLRFSSLSRIALE